MVKVVSARTRRSEFDTWREHPQNRARVEANRPVLPSHQSYKVAIREKSRLLST
jgi:hypothetical protein